MKIVRVQTYGDDYPHPYRYRIFVACECGTMNRVRRRANPDRWGTLTCGGCGATADLRHTPPTQDRTL